MSKTLLRAGIAAALTAASLTGTLLATDTAHAATQSKMTCSDGQDAQHYACTVTGTTDQPSVTLPLKVSDGVDVPVGTYPMASGAGTMTITKDSITFTFNDAFLATHTAPYTFSGGFDFRVDSYNVAGPFSVTVDGKTYTTPGPGGYCDAECQAEPAHGTFKSAWDNGDGRVGFDLQRGVESVVPGQEITFTDVAGPGQGDCRAALYQQRADGSWQEVLAATTTGSKVTATWTPTEKGALRLSGTCRIDGSREVYTDSGTIAGVAVTAKTAVTSAWADGKGGTPPTPPTPSLPPTVKTVTETYQVDVATLRSKTVLNKYLAADDDRKLAYRELGALWKEARYAKYFSEKHEYVTITVPVNATTKQRIAAINAKTKLGDVKTTATAGPSKLSKATVVYAWKLDTAHGARAKDGGIAWGPKHNLSQTFVARG